MTDALTREVVAVQNPALGATLLWRFVIGHYEAQQRATPLHLLFLPLPILFRQEFVDVITGTSRRLAGVLKASGLRAFADGLRESSNAKHDLLLLLHDEVRELRPLSLEAFRVAVAAGLLTVDASASVVPIRVEKQPSITPERVRRLLFGAEKLGYWCGSMTMYEISTTLHLSF